MLILGIETATERVSVAVGGHEGVIGLFEITKGRRHVETLVPAIEFMLRQADIELDEISVVAVDVGPGLFTGMRVGLAENFERPALQRVAGKNGGRFVKRLVRGRLAAPQIVIVHAGKVVVDQRIYVNALDREAHPQCPFPVDMEQPAGCSHQHQQGSG